MAMTSKIVLFTLVASLLGACSSTETKEKENESTVIAIDLVPPVSLYEEDEVEDTSCLGDFVVSVDSLHHVTFSDTLEGYEISADFVPDTAYSENVGHINYLLSDRRGKQCVATTYNHFYSTFDEEFSTRRFSKTFFLDSLDRTDCVPFKFFDVDFDGIKEFLVVHEGYNYKYYEVFKKDRQGHFVKADTPPYNQIVNGYSAYTTFDAEEKTISISQSSGCMNTRTEVYKLLGKGANKRFKCIEQSLVERVGEDSVQYTTWGLVNNQLQIVSQEINPE